MQKKHLQLGHSDPPPHRPIRLIQSVFSTLNGAKWSEDTNADRGQNHRSRDNETMQRTKIQRRTKQITEAEKLKVKSGLYESMQSANAIYFKRKHLKAELKHKETCDQLPLVECWMTHVMVPLTASFPLKRTTESCAVMQSPRDFHTVHCTQLTTNWKNTENPSQSQNQNYP